MWKFKKLQGTPTNNKSLIPVMQSLNSITKQLARRHHYKSEPHLEPTSKWASKHVL
jgi:hypothetical protein